MDNRLIILGASGNSTDIVDSVADINAQSGKAVFECMGFLDDNADLHGTTFHGLPVLGAIGDAPDYDGAVFVNGVGSINTYWRRDEIVAATGLGDDRFVSIIHPSASIAPSASVGTGCALFANVSVSAGAAIGDHVMVLAGSGINHHSTIGDHCCLATGAAISGNVTVGRLSFIGANAAIHPDISIGERTVVGMGAAVLEDVGDDVVVAGVPAKQLRKRT